MEDNKITSAIRGILMGMSHKLPIVCSHGLPLILADAPHIQLIRNYIHDDALAQQVACGSLIPVIRRICEAECENRKLFDDMYTMMFDNNLAMHCNTCLNLHNQSLNESAKIKYSCDSNNCHSDEVTAFVKFTDKCAVDDSEYTKVFTELTAKTKFLNFSNSFDCGNGIFTIMVTKSSELSDYEIDGISRELLSDHIKYSFIYSEESDLGTAQIKRDIIALPTVVVNHASAEFTAKSRFD